MYVPIVWIFLLLAYYYYSIERMPNVCWQPRNKFFISKLQSPFLTGYLNAKFSSSPSFFIEHFWSTVFMELERAHPKISTTAGTSPCSSPKAHSWARTKPMNYPGVTSALKARASLKAQRGSKHVFAFIACKARWRLRSSDRGPQGLTLKMKVFFSYTLHLHSFTARWHG